MKIGLHCTMIWQVLCIVCGPKDFCIINLRKKIYHSNPLENTKFLLRPEKRRSSLSKRAFPLCYYLNITIQMIFLTLVKLIFFFQTGHFPFPQSVHLLLSQHSYHLNMYRTCPVLSIVLSLYWSGVTFHLGNLIAS